VQAEMEDLTKTAPLYELFNFYRYVVMHTEVTLLPSA
jgi:hypothetical protein